MDKVEELIGKLSSSDYLTRVNSAFDLGELRDERAVEPLIELLNVSDGSARHAAAEALNKIGGARAVEALSDALRDSDEAIARVAERAVSGAGTAGLLASSRRRFVNLVVDGVIIVLLVRLFTLPGQSSWWGVLAYFFYYFVTEGVFHRSPAKLLTGTRVVTEDNQTPRIAQIAIRSLCRLVPIDPFSGSDGTWWHDRKSKTRVIKG